MNMGVYKGAQDLKPKTPTLSKFADSDQMT